MRKLSVIVILVAAGCCLRFVGCTGEKKSGVEKVKALTTVHIAALKQYVSDTLLPTAQRRAPVDSLRPQFLRTRLLYKKIEWATEYFMGNTTRLVNGPPLPEVEPEENKITEPEGLQVMEAMLHPAPDSVDYAEWQRQVRLLLSHCGHYATYWGDLTVDSSQIFDAVRLQLFRTAALGVTGFDASLAQSSLPEAATGVEAVHEVLIQFDGADRLSPLFQKATAFLRSSDGFNSFDRLAYLKEYSEPLTKAVVGLQKDLAVPFVQDHRLLRPSAASLFESGAFNANAYTQDSTYWSTPAKVALGKALFYDNVLSQNNTRSCATCHQPAKAFTDGLATSAGINHAAVNRNAPTLLNAALQPSQFYDMRTTNLENQSRDVIRNKAEMHGDLTGALKEIVAKPAYAALLKEAFPAAVHTEGHLQNAIASYVRSLALLNSRFDNYMRGTASLTDDEKAGFNLFAGKAKCATCHFIPLFNGTVPPGFAEMESEVIGVPGRDGKGLDSDAGRGGLYNLAPFQHAFKTTTVRNAARTAPYMHNGAFNTLEEVVEFYEKGGGAGLGFTMPNQTLPAEPLHLTAAEKKQIIAFMQSLTDDVPGTKDN